MRVFIHEYIHTVEGFCPCVLDGTTGDWTIQVSHISDEFITPNVLFLHDFNAKENGEFYPEGTSYFDAHLLFLTNHYGEVDATSLGLPPSLDLDKVTLGIPFSFWEFGPPLVGFRFNEKITRNYIWGN
jgi:hypothetical protein